MGAGELGNGYSTSTCLVGSFYDSSGCFNLTSALDKVREWWQLSWTAFIRRRTFERFSFLKLWTLWPRLPSWLARKQLRLGKEIQTPDLQSTTTATLIECIHPTSFLSLSIDELNFENVKLTAPYFFIADGAWQWAGFDSACRQWRHLPPLTYLPAYCKPDLDLFKEYLVCTHRGIVCMNVSKSTEDRLIIFNVLTGRWKELPPLIHRRNPVLMHLVVDPSTQSYQVIVAGSSRPGDERLSKITEVFDSRTWKWTRTGDLPGPGYALNEYQSGIYKDGDLYCIAFLEAGRGILRYNLSKGVWLKNWTYPIAFAANSNILQLVECGGELYLFSEQETSERRVEHCIDRVESVDMDGSGGVGSWSTVVRCEKMGGRSLEVYPEHTCVPYSEYQLCVFNTVDHSGVVYDVKNHGQAEVLLAPPARGFSGESFFSLNALSFTIEPSFRSKI